MSKVIEKMRKPTKSKNFVNYVVYALIFGMIIASFVLMIPGLGGGGVQSASDAATVGSTTISRREYLDQVKQIEEQYARIFNGEFPEAMRPSVRKRALDSLVRTEVLANYAQNKGLMVAADEVGFMLKEVPVFQEEGEFSRDRYDNYLSYVGKSASQFENTLKKQIATQRLSELFADGLMSPPQEKKLSDSADSTSIEYAFIELSPNYLKSQIKVEKAEVLEILSTDEGREAVKLFYPRVKSDFVDKEKVKLSQILLDGKASDALKKADELRASLTVENFADKAKELSIDPLGKASGGDLGFIEKGEFIPEVEAKAFSMSAGEISDPIKTPEGYAIILVGEKKEEQPKEFTDVHEEVAKLYLQSEGAKSLQKEFSKFIEEKKFDDLSARAKTVGLEWKNPGKFSLSDSSLPGIGQSSEIENALFSLEKEGDIYEKPVQYQGKEYLLKLVKINKVPDEKDKKSPQLNPGSRGGNLVESLYQKHREELNVQVNPALFES